MSNTDAAARQRAWQAWQAQKAREQAAYDDAVRRWERERAYQEHFNQVSRSGARPGNYNGDVGELDRFMEATQPTSRENQRRR